MGFKVDFSRAPEAQMERLWCKHVWVRKQTKRWHMRDGTPIRICDMTDTHLYNSVRLLQRRAEARRIFTEMSYVWSVPPNGEMAQDAFNQEFGAVLQSDYTDYVPPIYEAMVLDLERRGIEPPKQPQNVALEVKLLQERLAAAVMLKVEPDMPELEAMDEEAINGL